MTQETVRVLLVDDEHLMRWTLRVLLQSAGDVTIIGEASDGAEVVEQVARNAPDVVVMDIKMPGLDGLRATEQIKASHPQVCVILTSVSSLYVGDALRAGADRFMTKAVVFEQLVAAVLECVPKDRQAHA